MNQMNVQRCRSLISERKLLKKLIRQSSPGNVIGRLSLVARLKQVERKLGIADC